MLLPTLFLLVFMICLMHSSFHTSGHPINYLCSHNGLYRETRLCIVIDPKALIYILAWTVDVQPSLLFILPFGLISKWVSGGI